MRLSEITIPTLPAASDVALSGDTRDDDRVHLVLSDALRASWAGDSMRCCNATSFLQTCRSWVIHDNFAMMRLLPFFVR